MTEWKKEEPSSGTWSMDVNGLILCANGSEWWILGAGDEDMGNGLARNIDEAQALALAHLIKLHEKACTVIAELQLALASAK